MLIFERFQSADTAAHDHSEALAIRFFHVDTGILHRHFRGAHRHLCKTIGPLYVFRIIKNVSRLEVANFAGDPAIVVRRIKSRYRPDAAPALEQVIPEKLQLTPEGRDNAHTCDDNSSIIHKEVISDQ